MLEMHAAWAAATLPGSCREPAQASPKGPSGFLSPWQIMRPGPCWFSMCLQDSNTLDAWATSSRPVWQPHAACKRRLVGSMASSNPWFIPFLTLNASTAYLVNLFNFQVTKHTSALTLQVLAFRSRLVTASYHPSSSSDGNSK